MVDGLPLNSTNYLRKAMNRSDDKSKSNDCQTMSASNRESKQELHSTKGQSVPDVNKRDKNDINSENNQKPNEDSEDLIDQMVSKSHVLEEKRERSLRWRHLRDVQQLKSDNLKLRNELNLLKRSQTRINITNKKLNQLMSENERLKNELLFSRNLNQILLKIKEYFETNFKNLLSVNNFEENHNFLNNLLNEYEKVSNQSQTNLKYKSVVNQLNTKFDSEDNKTSVKSINGLLFSIISSTIIKCVFNSIMNFSEETKRSTSKRGKSPMYGTNREFNA